MRAGEPSFSTNSVMCAPINTVAEAFEDPQVKHRKVVIEVEHPTAGPIPMVANPIRMSETPVPTPKMAPRLGEHTQEVLGGLLGMNDGDIADLRAKAAI